MITTYSPQINSKEDGTFGKWQVTKEGHMIWNQGKYEIHSTTLTRDWIAHMFEKKWIDWNDFIPAYFQALKNAGIEKFQCIVFYKASDKKI